MTLIAGRREAAPRHLCPDEFGSAHLLCSALLCTTRRVGRGLAKWLVLTGESLRAPDALAILHSWRDHDLLRRALGIFGLASLAESEQAPAEVVELAERRQSARTAGDFGEADRLRGEIEASGWEARDVADGYQLVPK